MVLHLIMATFANLLLLCKVPGKKKKKKKNKQKKQKKKSGNYLLSFRQFPEDVESRVDNCRICILYFVFEHPQQYYGHFGAIIW